MKQAITSLKELASIVNGNPGEYTYQFYGETLVDFGKVERDYTIPLSLVNQLPSFSNPKAFLNI